jgi:hypothetical protein
MNDLHCLYTNGQDVLRIVRYVHPTPSIEGHFILSRDDKGCEVTLKDFLKDWRVFNAHAAFADYLLYTDEILMDCRGADSSDLTKSLIKWAKERSLEIGILWATSIKPVDLIIYDVDLTECLSHTI